MTTKLIAGIAAALMLAAAAPAFAQSFSYPYTYFTGPMYFVGSGGYYQGQVFNPYAAYGPGTLSYNPMTGQLTSTNSSGSYGYGSNYSSYGYSGSYYGSSVTGQGGCNSYIPNNACGIIAQYTQYIPTGYGY